MMADNDNQQTKKTTKAYGKRPVWQWVLIYLVIAVIVYGLIYYIFINGGDDGGSSSSGGGYGY